MAQNNLKGWRSKIHNTVPIFSPILFACSYTEDDNAGIGTFCVNPDTMEITYSPKFANSQTFEENVFALTHEAGHVLCDHLTRREKMKTREGKMGFDEELFTEAAEVAVNALVSGLSGWVVPKDLVQVRPEYVNISTEEIYMDLKKNPSKSQTKKGHKCNVCIDSKATGKGDAGSEMVKVQAMEGAGKEAQSLAEKGSMQPGSMPGELKELGIRAAKMITKPNWEEMLKRFMMSQDFNPKNFDQATIYRRRLAQDGLCLPNLSSSPAAKRFVVSMDNSGSVSDEMFARLKAVINDVGSQLGFQEIVVQHFTTQVMYTEKVSSLKKLGDIKRRADGGTTLDDCDAKAAGHKGQFHIILTDGYVEWLPKYALPTVIVRTVADTPEAPKVKNLIGNIVCDSKKDFKG